MEKKEERDLHWLAPHSRSGDTSFVLSHSNPCTGVGHRAGRQWRCPVPDGSWKDCQCRVHNEDGQTTSLSNVANDLLKALEMEAPYCRDCCHAMNNSLFLH